MNREIKFRAWHIDLEDMTFSNGSSSDFWSKVDKYPSMYRVMQYTGLKDRNGKEIYEGDIWKERISTINGFVEVIFTIVYDDEYAAFAVMVDSNEEDTREINRSWANEVEIVGNIYETPHLLNKEQGAQESDTSKAT